MAEVKKEVSLKPIKKTRFIMNIHKISNFYPYNFEYGKRVIRYQELDIFDYKYRVMVTLFESSLCNLRVHRVVKIYNPYLKKGVELKRHLCYKSAQPAELFYGTKDEHIDSICKYNFNWRSSAASEPSQKFGKGVHFTTDLSFAATFCDPGPHKVIILAYVLLKNKYTGNEELVVPPTGSDTAVGQTANGASYVKFADNEFYPLYLIHCISKEE